ncbi:TonB-dependent receptor [Chitinophaga sedimenti]|uniref:SusC/RagA family TonB-linked outer membrane protein n=1 Tax=Chitinophaga sedimenti TaxID=2033606 RepID=UPI002002C6D9|nr:TonB-dependent receptor [Chitinophaga sedimenti]MCK7556298.1 TonB-dependent receptor [Chitinophaga sedimenti]
MKRTVSSMALLKYQLYLRASIGVIICLCLSLAATAQKPDSSVLISTFNGKQLYQEVTGAFTQVKGRPLENVPIINNSNRLQGTLAGLIVMQNNGEPGSESAEIQMRGKRTFRDNSPIVLVDGFERSMEFLDPNEIETITLLKDAAATAQYGLRGGNGVVLVTTKRGKEGPIKITFNARGGVKAPTTTPKLLNSFQYATLYNEALTNDGAAPKYSAADLEKYKNAAMGVYESDIDRYLYPNINWYDQYVNEQTWQQRYSVDVRGGNKNARYFLSAGYTGNSGLYKVDKAANTYNTNADFNMVTIRSNIDVNVNKRFSLTLDLAGRREQRTYPGARGDAALRVFRTLYKTPPNAFPVLTPDGKLGGTKDFSQNPYGLLNKQGYSLYYVRSMFATLRGKHELDFITPGLSITGAVAFDSWYDMVTNRSKSFKVYDLRQANGNVEYNPNGSIKYVETGSDTQMGSGVEYPGTRRILNYEGALNYQRTFGLHAVSAVAAVNQRIISSENNENIPRAYLGSNGRVSYAYNKRYLAEFNYGFQGSEQFLPGNKFGFFPAGSLGWVISEEAFMKDATWVNLLKLRGSYGITGNDDVGGYFLWFQKYQSAGGPNFGYTSVGYNGFQETAFSLDNVTWEKVHKTNVGIDVTLMKNRLNFSFDYFYEKNNDIMIQPALPYIMGIRFPDFPIGIIENKGFDASLQYTQPVGDVELSFMGNITSAKNKVLNRGEEKPLFAYQARTGRPLDGIYGLQAQGLFKDQAEIDASPRQTFGQVKPGDIKYKDQNGDNVIDAYDEVYLGQGNFPTMQYGVGFGAKYKGFDLGLMFTGHSGQQLPLTGESIWEFHDNGTVRDHHLGRFNPEDATTWENASYPRLSLANKANNQRTSTYWLRDGKMVRLKTMELGYTLPQQIAKKIKLDNLRIYASGYNLFTWSSTDLVDTEARSGHYVLYPIQRIINAGISVSF